MKQHLARLRSRIRVLSRAALCLAASGCAGFRREPLDPRAELAALRSRGDLTRIVEHRRPGEDAAAREDRFDPTDGLDEAELVTVALTLNPAIQARRLEAGEARSALLAAGIWPNPELELSSRPGLGTPGTAIELDFLFEILSPWKRSAAKAAAGFRVDEVTASIAAEEWRLAGKVRSRHWEVVFLERSLAAIEEEARLRRRVAVEMRAGVAAGERSELDASLAELDLAEARRRERRARTALEAARRELCTLLGLPSAYPLRLEASEKPAEVAVYEDLTDGELERRLLEGRFELRAAEAAYRRAEEELRLAVLEQIPGPKVGPSFERDSGGGHTLGVGLGIEVPLFDRKQGEIKEKRARRDRLRAEYAAVLHRLLAEAEGARERVRRAKLDLEAQERELLPILARSESLVEEAFRARELSLNEFATARERALRLRLDYLEALFAYRSGLAELEAALGTRLERPATHATGNRSPP